MQGQVALVTGCASKRGLGRAIALRLAKDGADLVISDVSQFDVLHEEAADKSWKGLEDVAMEIKALGRKALIAVADISSSRQVEDMVKKIVDTFGKIDILVNNASVLGPSVTALEITDQDWNKVLAIDLSGTFFCSRAVARKMVERGRGGKIVNIASVAAKEPMKRRVAYAAAKSGVVAITQVMALELGRHKIRVNAICPGSIFTEMGGAPMVRGAVQTGVSEEDAFTTVFGKLVSQVPLGRVGQPEDIAKVAAFLASDESDYMTGQAINVDGGWVMAR